MSLTYDVLSKLLGDDYVTEPAVPILDEHVLTDSRGENEMMVDAAFLAEVAANNNARVEQTGDPTPLIVGHTEDHPGRDEKPVVGYATNFRVEPFFETGRQALFADFHVPKAKQSILKEYPRRSVELWPKKREVDPISLLGGTTPERDLSILRFRRGRDDDSISIPFQRECYAMADEKKTDDVKSAEKSETSGNREISSKLDKLLQLLEPLAEMLSEAMQPPADAKDADKTPPAAADEEPKKGDKPPADDDDLLGPADADEQTPPPDKEGAEYHDTPVKFGETYLPRVTKMSRQPIDDAVVKLQRQTKQLEKENAELKLLYARANAEKTVKELEDRDGIVFATREADIEMIARLSGDAKKHFVEETIKKNYARDLTKVEDLARYSREAIDKPQKTMKDVQAEIDAAWQEAYGKKGR